MKKRMLTYQEFADESGGIAAAALRVGVDPSTYSRWVTGVSKPRGLALRRLTALGVAIR